MYCLHMRALVNYIEVYALVFEQLLDVFLRVWLTSTSIPIVLCLLLRKRETLAAFLAFKASIRFCSLSKLIGCAGIMFLPVKLCTRQLIYNMLGRVSLLNNKGGSFHS